MDDHFDAFVNKLQEEIFDEAKEAFGEAGFQRWRNPKYNGRMKNCDTSAKVKGTCGDTMEIFLKFAGCKVQSASYFTDGCASSSICGSFTVEMAIGKDPDELANITGEAVLNKIGRFPEEDKHCAFLAAETLQEALRHYMIRETTNKRHDRLK
jgi:NifU-like protein involved in Fe-S cluster formation